MEKEYNVSCMKYRTSTHLAGCDVEEIIDLKGKCILKIEESYYTKQAIVNGKKQDGYFIHFSDKTLKPWKVNSTNRKEIAKLVMKERGLSKVESIKINNWVGFEIELYFDPDVKMKGEITGGVRVVKDPVKIKLTPLEDNRLQGAIDAIKAGTTTLEKIKTRHTLTEEQEKALTI